MIPKSMQKEVNLPQAAPEDEHLNLSVELAQDNLVCLDCSKKLSKDNAMKAILRKTCDIITLCSRCVDRRLLLKHLHFYESLPNFEKRVKTGYITQLMEEFKKHEKNKRHLNVGNI